MWRFWLLKNLYILRFKSPAYAITWPDVCLGNTLKFLDHKDDGNFSGSGKRISITMTTAWRCAPCQRMRRIQIIQWSGSRACNLLAKIEFRCGWLREHTQVRQYPPAAIKISALLPERYSPPNPESAPISHNLGWHNYKADSRFAPSQWETALLCNNVSHSLK